MLKQGKIKGQRESQITKANASHQSEDDIFNSEGMNKTRKNFSVDSSTTLLNTNVYKSSMMGYLIRDSNEYWKTVLKKWINLKR